MQHQTHIVSEVSNRSDGLETRQEQISTSVNQLHDNQENLVTLHIQPAYQIVGYIQGDIHVQNVC